MNWNSGAGAGPVAAFNRWWTDEDGKAGFRAFYGRHRVTVDGDAQVAGLGKTGGAKPLRIGAD